MLDSSSELDLVCSLRERIRRHKPCKGYGQVLKDGKIVTCECKAEAMYEFRLSRSGIPPRLRRMGFKDYVYKESPAYARIQEYLANAEQNRREGMGLYLYGPSYTGKSLLSCSLIMELMRRGWDCKYLAFDGMLDSAKEEGKHGTDTSWDFLVLDRVGDVLNRLNNFRESLVTGDRTHGAVEYLAGLVSARLNAGRPIIMPSSVSLQDVNLKFPSLANALIGSCIYVECEDKGFRQKRIELMMDPEN